MFTYTLVQVLRRVIVGVVACPQPLIWILCTTSQFSGSSGIEFRCWKCAGDLVTAELSLLLLAHQKLDHEPAPGSIFENSRTHRTLQDNHQTFKCTRFHRYRRPILGTGVSQAKVLCHIALPRTFMTSHCLPTPRCSAGT